jgi:hypothetical protein
MPQITYQASAYSVFGYAPQQLQKEASEVQSSATAQCCSHARSVRVHAVVVASEGRMVQANQNSMPSDGILKITVLHREHDATSSEAVGEGVRDGGEGREWGRSEVHGYVLAVARSRVH